MKTKIMLIDAHPVYALKVAGFLESLTFKDITIIPGGSQAMQALEEHKPDIVVISATLPDADSVTVAQQIKAQCPSTAMIVQTGLLTPPDRLEAFKSAGADYVITRREKDWAPFQDALTSIVAAAKE